MTSVITRRKTCRMCSSRNLKLVFQMAPSPIGDAFITEKEIDHTQDLYPIDLFMCQDCGLSQLTDIIDPNILYKDYIYVTGSSFGLSEHFRSYAEDVVNQLSLPPGSLVVDIGSNDGTLLRFFKDHDMQVLGIDPASEIAQNATRAGIETLPEFFTPDLAKKIRNEYGSATLIVANNVFANIDDLNTLGEGVRTLLADDGVFTFESFYLADVIQNMVFDFIYHEHLSSFSVKPVQRFFECIGMELFDVKRVPTKGGSLRYFVQKADGPRAIETALTSLIDFEEQLGLYSPKMFSTFSDTVDELKAETHSLLQDLKAKGKHIAGFGASITGTTLIYHFGIGEFLDYLIDDNPAKQGRFSPGLHLPVFPSDALYERKPDYVIVLAWRFVEPIVKKNNAYLEQGGHFIVPVPEVRII